MELWGWLVGYVLLFALLHLLLYYVYARRDEGERVQSPPVTDPGRAQSGASFGPDQYATDGDGSTERDGGAIDGESIRCPHCGTHNEADQTFTYCWSCISALRQ
jgi:hypothetical protein